MKRCKWLTFLSCGMLILLMSCSKGQQTSIKLGEVTRSLFYAPQYVALEKDFFADEGLDVELQTTWGGDKTMTALLSDGIDSSCRIRDVYLRICAGFQRLCCQFCSINPDRWNISCL